MRIAYFDCQAGIAGDMTVAALLELGVPLAELDAVLASLPLPRTSYRIDSERVRRQGIMATRFDVRITEHQPHRHYAEIAGMIEASSLAERVKAVAQRIFFRLAEAEARVHGVEMEKVHFHEVGAVDSIVDIVGTAFCLDYLGIAEVHASAVPFGGGWVDTAHGRLPVPAPATVELLKGVPVEGAAGAGERVTPTGAAVLAELCNRFGPPPAMRIEGIGYGAGSRDFPDVPNVLRVVLGEKSVTLHGDEVVVIESHIDDMNPELLGFLMERLLAEGALDAAFAPLQMKKNRSGIRLTVLAPPASLDTLARLILTESTAIGIRHYPVRRIKLDRVSEERETSLGLVRVKVITGVDGRLRVVPEFDECRRIALERQLPLIDVYRLIERETATP